MTTGKKAKKIANLKKPEGNVKDKSEPVTRSKKVTEVSFLRGLMDGSEQTNTRSATGIETRYSSSMTLRKVNGFEFTTFPGFHGFCGGYAKIHPNCMKKSKVTEFTMNFLILIGHVELLSGKTYKEYKPGTVITIPKGVKYGLRNKRSEICFMRYQTLPENELSHE